MTQATSLISVCLFVAFLLRDATKARSPLSACRNFNVEAEESTRNPSHWKQGRRERSHAVVNCFTQRLNELK
jgi:hypothetical protein